MRYRVGSPPDDVQSDLGFGHWETRADKFRRMTKGLAVRCSYMYNSV